MSTSAPAADREVLRLLQEIRDSLCVAPSEDDVREAVWLATRVTAELNGDDRTRDPAPHPALVGALLRSTGRSTALRPPLADALDRALRSVVPPGSWVPGSQEAAAFAASPVGRWIRGSDGARRLADRLIDALDPSHLPACERVRLGTPPHDWEAVRCAPNCPASALARWCGECGASIGQGCSSLRTPVTVGDFGPEFHAGR